MATALRGKCKLCEILPAAGMAESSCEYARNAQDEGGAEGRAAAGKAVIEAFEAGGGTCGYRRILMQVDADAEPEDRVGERAVRAIMEEERLVFVFYNQNL